MKMMNENDLEIEVNFDFCPRCGEYIDLSQPHSYEREEGRPIHRECEKPKNNLEKC